MVTNEENNPLFDSLRDFLSTEGSSESNEPVIDNGDTLALDLPLRVAPFLSHPYMQVSTDDVPTIVDEVLGAFLHPDMWEVAKEESMVAYTDMISAIRDMETNNYGRHSLGRIMIGDRIDDDPTLEVRMLTRLLMLAPFLAMASLRRGSNPNADGQFTGGSELRVACSANDLIRVVRSIAAAMRAEHQLNPNAEEEYKRD